MEIKPYTVVRYSPGDNVGKVHAFVCGVGRTRVHLVWIGNGKSGVVTSAEPKMAVEAHAVVLDGYTPKRVVRQMLAAGRSLGITKGAKKLLTEAKKHLTNGK